jgi:hypothetical protein
MTKANYKKSAGQKTMSTQRSVRAERGQNISTPRLKRKVMRFGKYKNYEFNALPIDYLQWAILNLKDDHLLDDLIRELQRRDSSFIV